MELEQKRGISITSTVLQFPYRDHVAQPARHARATGTSRRTPTGSSPRPTPRSWCSTPPRASSRRPSSCSRSAGDAGLPLLTFINKWDRPGREPLELLDEIEQQIGLTPDAGDLAGRHRRRLPGRRRPARTVSFIRFTRTARGATDGARGASSTAERRGRRGGRRLDGGAGGARAARRRRRGPRPEAFLAGESTPVFFGSALTNFGVGMLLDAVVDLAPSPHRPVDDDDGRPPARRPVLRRSCSRCRPTWTRRTATASRSSACARAGSSAAWS